MGDFFNDFNNYNNFLIIKVIILFIVYLHQRNKIRDKGESL